MFKSIRSILYFSFTSVGIICFLVIVLGLRHVQISNHFSETTALAERVLFSFGTVREQVTEALISRDYSRVDEIIPAIEQLNHTISRLYDSGSLPAQYKLAMAERIDLTGLVLSLRTLQNSERVVEASLSLQREMRLIAERLFKVDRIITGQIRDTVVGFQLSMIGAMGIFISCASFILLLLYRRAVKPLLALAGETEYEGIEEAGFTCPAEAGSEIERFVRSVNELLARPHEPGGRPEDERARDGALLSTTINETANNLNAMINYAQLILETSVEVDLSAEQRDMLRRIIASGERLAEQWNEAVSGLSSSRRVAGSE